MTTQSNMHSCSADRHAHKVCRSGQVRGVGPGGWLLDCCCGLLAKEKLSNYKGWRREREEISHQSLSNYDDKNRPVS